MAGTLCNRVGSLAGLSPTPPSPLRGKTKPHKAKSHEHKIPGRQAFSRVADDIRLPTNGVGAVLTAQF